MSRPKADRLWSQLVRARGVCERCGGRDGLQAAHIIRRSYMATRCDPDNGWCLCVMCHPYPVDTDRTVFCELVRQTVTVDGYERLLAKARSGVGVSYRQQHWDDICEDLAHRVGKIRR